MVFQVLEAGRAYYLGDLDLDYSVDSGGPQLLSFAVKDNSESGRAARLAGLPAEQIPAEERALLSRFGAYPGDAYFRGSDGDKKWNAYLDMVIADLDGRGIRLLTARTSPLAATDRKSVAASFAQRRQEIEAKWTAKIAGIRRLHCPPASAIRRCKNIVGQAEAERDAELKALEAEQRLAMGSDEPQAVRDGDPMISGGR
jgi:hypothetical protein